MSESGTHTEQRQLMMVIERKQVIRLCIVYLYSILESKMSFWLRCQWLVKLENYSHISDSKALEITFIQLRVNAVGI